MSPLRMWILPMVMLVGLLVLSGCGPGGEQRAMDAYNQGIRSFENGLLDESIAQFTESLRLNPQFEQAWCNRGTARLKASQYEEALADYSQALQLDPEDSIALVMRFAAASSAQLKKPSDLPTGGRTEFERTGRPPRTTSLLEVENEETESSPPSARRVTARALVLAAVVYRSDLEVRVDTEDAEELRRRLLGWIDAVGLSSELEQGERDFLETRLGRADQQTLIDGFYREEKVWQSSPGP